MGLIAFFKEWLINNEERRKFKEAWQDHYGKDMGTGNTCSPYHEKVAYEIYRLTQRVEELEKKIV